MVIIYKIIDIDGGKPLTFNPNPKTYVDKNGYRHFLSSRKLVHRWVMEKYLKRKLKRTDVVHHRNGNKLDNRVDNLQVIVESDAWGRHQEIHQKNKEENGFW